MGWRIDNRRRADLQLTTCTPYDKSGHDLIGLSIGLLKLLEKGARLAPKLKEHKHANHRQDDRHEEGHGESVAVINLL